MINARRLIAVVCIAVMVVAAVIPAASHLFCDALIPLGPLFGTVIAAPLPADHDPAPQRAPFVCALASRAPPPA